MSTTTTAITENDKREWIDFYWDTINVMRKRGVPLDRAKKAAIQEAKERFGFIVKDVSELQEATVGTAKIVAELVEAGLEAEALELVNLVASNKMTLDTDEPTTAHAPPISKVLADLATLEKQVLQLGEFPNLSIEKSIKARFKELQDSIEQLGQAAQLYRSM